MSPGRQAACALAVGVAGSAWAGPSPVDVTVSVLAEDPEVVDVAAFVGAERARGVRTEFAGIRPLHGTAMAAFSTGELDGPPRPGADLAVVGVEDDRAGLQLGLRVPPGTHSLRLAYQLVVGDASQAEGDRVRLLVQGEPIALDPWTRSDLRDTTAALSTGPRPEGPGWQDGGATGWMEVVLPVQAGSQLALRVDVADGDGPLGDSVLLLDGLAFAPGRPSGVLVGAVPRLSRLEPTALRIDTTTTVLLEGAQLPSQAEVAVRSADGTERLAAWQGLSTERARISVPGLDEGSWDVILSFPGGQLTWPDALSVGALAPRLTSVTPTTGPVEGGTAVLLVGEGLLGDSTAWFGQQEASLEPLGPGVLAATLPPGEPGPVDVSVRSGGREAQLGAAFVYGVPASSPSPPGELPPDSGCGSAPGAALLLLGLARRRGPR